MKFLHARLGFIALGAATLAALSAAGAAQAAGPAAGDVGRGKTVFARCVACHDLNTGAVRMGPSLKGIMGRKAGSAANFGYSSAMKSKGVTWSPDTLNAFLAAPMKYVPGTRMGFAGVTDAQERADLIAYLKTAAK